MAELADAPDLGSGISDVQVRPLLPAPADKVGTQISGGDNRNPNLITRWWGSDLSSLTAPKTPRWLLLSRCFALYDSLTRTRLQGRRPWNLFKSCYLPPTQKGGFTHPFALVLHIRSFLFFFTVISPNISLTTFKFYDKI